MRRLIFASACIFAVTSCSDWPGVGNDTSGSDRLEDKSGNIGSSCGSTVTCNSGLSCVTSAPGGLCTKNCSSDSDCSGGVCAYVANWGGMICLKACSSDQVCRSSYSCVASTTGANVCGPGTSTADGG